MRVGSRESDLLPATALEKAKVAANGEPSATAAAGAGGLAACEQNAASTLAAMPAVLPMQTADTPPRAVAPLLLAAELLPPACAPQTTFDALVAQLQQQHELAAAANRVLADLLLRCAAQRSITERATEPVLGSVRRLVAAQVKVIANDIPAALNEACTAAHAAAAAALAAVAACGGGASEPVAAGATEAATGVAARQDGAAASRCNAEEEEELDK